MHPGATDYWDGNWLISPIEILVRGFEAKVGAGLRADELRRFPEELERLYESVQGEPRLDSMENWLELIAVGNGMGHITIRGEAIDRPGVGNRLTFRLGIDQTYLPAIIEQLFTAEQTYPILGNP